MQERRLQKDKLDSSWKARKVAMINNVRWYREAMKKSPVREFAGGPVVGLHSPMQRAQVWSQVGELRSHMLLNQINKMFLKSPVPLNLKCCTFLTYPPFLVHCLTVVSIGGMLWHFSLRNLIFYHLSHQGSPSVRVRPGGKEKKKTPYWGKLLITFGNQEIMHIWTIQMTEGWINEKRWKEVWWWQWQWQW